LLPKLQTFVDLLLQIGYFVQEILQLQVELVNLVLFLVSADARSVDLDLTDPIQFFDCRAEQKAPFVLFFDRCFLLDKIKTRKVGPLFFKENV
jgi:hypothetical protein